MAGYKLATYQSADGPRAGLVIDDKVFDAAKLTGKAAYATVLNIIKDWTAAKGVLKAAAAKAGKGRVKGQPLAKHQAACRRCCGRHTIYLRRLRTMPIMPQRWPADEPADRTRSAYPGPQGLAFHQGCRAR